MWKDRQHYKIGQHVSRRLFESPCGRGDAVCAAGQEGLVSSPTGRVPRDGSTCPRDAELELAESHCRLGHDQCVDESLQPPVPDPGTGALERDPVVRADPQGGHYEFLVQECGIEVATIELPSRDGESSSGGGHIWCGGADLHVKFPEDQVGSGRDGTGGLCGHVVAW